MTARKAMIASDINPIAFMSFGHHFAENGVVIISVMSASRTYIIVIHLSHLKCRN